MQNLPADLQGPAREAGVTGSLATALVVFALTRKVTFDELHARCGLTGLDVVQPSARLPEMTLVLIWRELAARFPHQPLPLLIARAAPSDPLGDLVFTARFARDLGQALDFISRNAAAVADRLELIVTTQGKEARIEIRHPMDALDQGRTSETLLGFLWRALSQQILPSVRITRADVRGLQQDGRQVYENFFGAPVFFSRKRVAISLSHEELDRPLPGANPELFEYGERYFEQHLRMLGQTRVAPDLSRLLRAIENNAAIGEFTITAAAKRANMSQRSAQRIAAKHGTTLKALIRDERINRAEDLLRDQTISVQEAAYLLGYKDDRAFRRAFEDWTGLTPSEYRRARGV